MRGLTPLNPAQAGSFSNTSSMLYAFRLTC
jgi:hypothetical protein